VIKIGVFPWSSKGFWGSVIVILCACYYVYLGQLEEAIKLFGIGLGLLGIRHAFETPE